MPRLSIETLLAMQAKLPRIVFARFFRDVTLMEGAR